MEKKAPKGKHEPKPWPKPNKKPDLKPSPKPELNTKPKSKQKLITPPRPMPKKKAKSKPKTKPRSEQKPIPEPSAGPIERFLHILNNKAKGDPSFGKPRERGFVVFVKEQCSLKPLEEACLNIDIQKWNQCITMRYKIDATRMFGTLPIKIALDLIDKNEKEMIFKNNKKLKMTLEYWVSESISLKWRKELIERWHKKIRGSLSAKEINSLFTLIDNNVVSGQRFVVLCELRGDEHDLSRWHAARKEIFQRLPERMGFVFSGSPGIEELEIDAEDPHYLDLELPDEELPEGTVYKHSALDSDVPTTVDYLNRRRYATALAGFILHPDVSPPLAVGILGDWGTGKSSFMEMIKEELERVNTAGEKKKKELMYARFYGEQQFKGIRFN